MADQFKADFTSNLERGADVLEDAGYDVDGYAVSFESNRTHITNWRNTPEEALEATIEEIREEGQMFLYTDGEEFSEVIQGNKDPSSIIYSSLTGSLDVDEPTVEPEWAQEPVPAFGTGISYTPEQPEGYWNVETMETQQPYDEEDAHARAEDIVDALTDEGFEAQKGFID